MSRLEKSIKYTDKVVKTIKAYNQLNRDNPLYEQVAAVSTLVSQMPGLPKSIEAWAGTPQAGINFGEGLAALYSGKNDQTGQPLTGDEYISAVSKVAKGAVALAKAASGGKLNLAISSVTSMYTILDAVKDTIADSPVGEAIQDALNALEEMLSDGFDSFFLGTLDEEEQYRNMADLVDRVYDPESDTIQLGKLGKGRDLMIDAIIEGAVMGTRDKYRTNAKDKYYTVYWDPLTLDLNNDGKLNVVGTDSGIHFDFNNDGLAGNTGWVSKEDGLLIFDANEDNNVTNGSELFGEGFIIGQKVREDGTIENIYAKNGFEALASLDTNKDGIVDANDKDFDKIKVWQDKNGNGKVDAGEMLTLKELGIVGLNTGYQNKNETVEGGNVLAEEGSFIREDGSTGLMGDINFIQDPTKAEFTDKVEMTEEQQKASYIEGMGRVRDLNEAMALSLYLKGLYDFMKQAPNKSAQMFAMQELLKAWSVADPSIKLKYAADFIFPEDLIGSIGSSNGSSSSSQTSFRIFEEYFVLMKAGSGGITVRPGNPNLGHLVEYYVVPDGIVDKIKIINAFYNLEERQFYFLGQEHLDQIVEQIEQTYDALEFMLYQQIAGETRLAKYTDLITIDLTTFTLDYSKVTAAIEEYAKKDPLNAAVDLYEFLAQGHAMNWQAGMDLFGQYYNNMQNQGLLGYYFASLGETHANYYATSGILAIKDQVVNGTADNDLLYGGFGNDIIYGGNGNDKLYGGNGNDKLYGGNGDDILYGGEGNDKLYAGWGDDILIGGKGDDYLQGDNSGYYDYKNTGNKTYQFSVGDGKDIINNYDQNNYRNNDTDIIKFTDVNSNEVTYRGENYDLIIEYGNGDSIRVQNFFKGNLYWINEIHFADGTVLTHTELAQINIPVTVTESGLNLAWGGELTITNDVEGGTTINTASNGTVITGSGNDVITGGAGSDTIYAGAGNDIVYGGNGDDVLYGEDGDDVLHGGNGDDILYGGDGNDKLYAGWGNDVLIGGKGDDYLQGGNSGNYDYKNTGNKTYQFSVGDGNDLLNNYDQNNHRNNDTDIIKFTDVNSDEVSYRGENYDLIIEYGNGDSIRVQNFFKGDLYWINEIHFADGAVVKQNQIQGLINAQNSRSSRMMAFVEEAIVPEVVAEMPMSMNTDVSNTDSYIYDKDIREVVALPDATVTEKKVYSLVDQDNVNGQMVNVIQPIDTAPILYKNAVSMNNMTSLQDSLNEYNQYFVKESALAPAMSQELHSLINAMAVFDAGSNERDSMVTSESSLTQPLLTSSY